MFLLTVLKFTAHLRINKIKARHDIASLDKVTHYVIYLRMRLFYWDF
jgi:hypothetical protein